MIHKENDIFVISSRNNDFDFEKLSKMSVIWFVRVESEGILGIGCSLETRLELTNSSELEVHSCFLLHLIQRLHMTDVDCTH